MYIDVNDYKDLNSDSAMIQAAVEAAIAGGEAVVIPKINRRTGSDVWDIDETIHLYSESTVILQNAHLRLADGFIGNMFDNSIARTLEGINGSARQHNITIKGLGSALLDGGIHNGLYEVNGVARDKSKYPDRRISENCMLFFKNICNLRIDGIKIKNHRYWGICLYDISYSHVSNIHYESDSNVPNQDGIDIMKGSHDIIVENISGCVGDNMVAMLATEDDIYEKVSGSGDIYNILVRNLLIYGVGGCALVRLLNHDGLKIYNISIDNIIETSPWSFNDAPVAQNPDLIIHCDEKGEPYHERLLVPGEAGYRCEAAVIIGESYWYSRFKAQPGDTYGIHISNIMTHSRYALFLNNVLRDSEISNIRIFGNGFMAAYFGEGIFENVTIKDIHYDMGCRPLPQDEHIVIEWNYTESRGFSCFYFHDSYIDNVRIEGVECGKGMDSVFAGYGKGNIIAKGITHGSIDTFSTAEGIEIVQTQL